MKEFTPVTSPPLDMQRSFMNSEDDHVAISEANNQDLNANAVGSVGGSGLHVNSDTENEGVAKGSKVQKRHNKHQQ